MRRCALLLAIFGVASIAGAATNAVPAKLVGRWVRPLQLEPAYPRQPWTISITKTGAIDVVQPSWALHFLQGTISVTGNRLVVRSGQSADRLRMGCPTANLYTWKLAGRVLTIKIVSDVKCPFRAMLLAGTWKRK